MDQLVLKQDGVQLQTQVEVLGSLEPYERHLSYEELNEQYDLDLDLERIEPDTNENGEFIVRLRMESGDTVATSQQTEEFGDLPPVPEVPPEEISDQRRPFYDRLKDPRMQPYDVRRIIFEEGELTEAELKEMLNDQGHDSVAPGKQHGGVAMTLVVLDEVTGEIERIGRGEDKTIIWIGEE